MARFGVKEVANVTLYNLETGKPELFLDTLKLSNLENSAESVSANGGSGSPKLVSWDFNRTATFNVQDALLNPKALSMQAGTELVRGEEIIYEREVKYISSTSTAVELSYTPETVGNITVYVTKDGYAHDSELVEGTDFSVVGKDLTVSKALGTGEKVIVYYTHKVVTAETITIKSDKFGGYYKVVGDTLWRNEATGKDEKVQLVIDKAKVSSAFTLTMQPDGEPSVFDFNLEVFKSPNSTDMVKMIRYNVA